MKVAKRKKKEFAACGSSYAGMHSLELPQTAIF